MIQKHKARAASATFNPIPTGHGRNQPTYERHVTTAGRNRVKKEGIFFLNHLFAIDILLMKKLDIEETKTT